MLSEGYDRQSGHPLNVMLRARFIYECADIRLWPGPLPIDSDINLKALEGDAVLLPIRRTVRERERV